MPRPAEKIILVHAGDSHGQAIVLLLVRRGHRESHEDSENLLVGEGGKTRGDLRRVSGRAVAGVHRERR